MKFDTEEHISQISDERKRRRLLRYCFNLDLECKKEGFYLNSFQVLHRKFNLKDVLYLSNLYLDNYANLDEKNLYYLIQEQFLLNLSNGLKNKYIKYRKVFYVFLKKGIYNKDFFKLIIYYKCDIEDLLEYINFYNMIFATKEEKDLFKKCQYEIVLNKNIEIFYYNLCMMFDFDYSAIMKMQILLNKNNNYIFQMLDKYINKNLNGEKPDKYIKLLNELENKKISI